MHHITWRDLAYKLSSKDHAKTEREIKNLGIIQTTSIPKGLLVYISNSILKCLFMLHGTSLQEETDTPCNYHRLPVASLNGHTSRVL